MEGRGEASLCVSFTLLPAEGSLPVQRGVDGDVNRDIGYIGLGLGWQRFRSQTALLSVYAGLQSYWGENIKGFYGNACEKTRGWPAKLLPALCTLRLPCPILPCYRAVLDG